MQTVQISQARAWRRKRGTRIIMLVLAGSPEGRRSDRVRRNAGPGPGYEVQPLHRDRFAGVLADAEPVRLLVEAAERVVDLLELATGSLCQRHVHLLIEAVSTPVGDVKRVLRDVPGRLSAAAVPTFLELAQDLEDPP